MTRATRLALLGCLAGALAPAVASAAPRMFVGFQDDPSFRWRDDRQQVLDQVRASNATVIRATIYWYRVAPTKPRNASNPFDPVYVRLNDVDELVRNAQARGLEVMLTIWGTPAWASAKKTPNQMPRNRADLTAFAKALSSRYSGRYAGYPFVRFYSVWNEPNLEQFLAPQFDAQGRSVSPALYARLYRAAYAGLKAGSPRALIGIGETSNRGRDRPFTGGTQQTHSPGRFAELLARADKSLKFDAWATHPYPTEPNQKPTQAVRWPNVTLSQLPRFEASLDTWFGRKNIPIWITEYGHQTTPLQPLGVSQATQRTYAREALAIASRDPRVRMFIWFTMRDDEINPWKSGLLDPKGRKKPLLAAFTATVRGLDARNTVLDVVGGRADPVIQVSALEIAAHSPAGAPVGVIWTLVDGLTVLSQTPEVRLGRDGWLSFKLPIKPISGHRYVLVVDAEDINGISVRRAILLVAGKGLIS